MENLASGSSLRSTIKTDILPKLLMESDRHLNTKIIDLIEEQEGTYIDDFYEIESSTWCLYFSCKYDKMYQMCINTNPKSEEYGIVIYDLNLIRVLMMTYPSSLVTLLEDPDVGIHRLLYNS